MAELTSNETDIREQVRQRYAAAALQVTTTDPSAGCCAPSDTFDGGSEVFGAALYALGDREQVPDTAALASLGCGNPTAVADLHEGETVLDLGSGGGIDVLLSAKRVGTTGLAYGLDMTDEMLALARENQQKAGVENVEWLRGHIEEIPLPAETVDVIISNCVINLSADKSRVIAEAARVLRPGGRFAVSDVIADEDMDDATRADMQAFTGCIAGALTRREFEQILTGAGFENIEIQETHRVHQHAGSAIIRATQARREAPLTALAAVGSVDVLMEGTPPTPSDHPGKPDQLDPDQLQPETWVVVSGRPEPDPGALMNTPVIGVSTYELGTERIYSRNEATEGWEAFEAMLGGLEGGQAVAFSSGMAACAAVLNQLPTGAHLVLVRRLLSGCRRYRRSRRARSRVAGRAAAGTRPAVAPAGHGGRPPVDRVAVQPAARGRRPRDRSAPRPAAPEPVWSSTTPSPRRCCSVPSSSAPTSSCTRRPS